MTRKRLLSGMQPTGQLHLGNLEGALRSWVRMQDDYEMFCFVADWHTLTTQADAPERIREMSYQVAADYIACGLDPEKCAIFVQSHVKEHAELHLLLSMITPLGWLERVPTFKDKRDNLNLNEESVSYGLLGYPVLMTSDILLYRAHAVPVGKDQVAHLEISREIARRFNHLYGEVFPEPGAVLNDAAIVPGLDGRKMSKSYGNSLYLADDADTISKKIMGAYTTESKIRKTDPGIPETCVVCQWRKLYDPKGYMTSWEEDRNGERGCVQSKRELIEIVNARLTPIRERRTELLSDRGQLDSILMAGAEKARAAAAETMQMVRSAMKMG